MISHVTAVKTGPSNPNRPGNSITEFMLSEVLTLLDFRAFENPPSQASGARNDHQLLQIHHTVLRTLQVQGFLRHKIHVTFRYRYSIIVLPTDYC